MPPTGKIGNRQIIVRFKHYKTKVGVYANTNNMKGNDQHIYMTEDLTKSNHDLMLRLLELDVLRPSGRWTAIFLSKSLKFHKPPTSTSMETWTSDYGVKVTRHVVAVAPKS